MHFIWKTNTPQHHFCHLDPWVVASPFPFHSSTETQISLIWKATLLSRCFPSIFSSLRRTVQKFQRPGESDGEFKPLRNCRKRVKYQQTRNRKTWLCFSKMGQRQMSQNIWTMGVCCVPCKIHRQLSNGLLARNRLLRSNHTSLTTFSLLDSDQTGKGENYVWNQDMQVFDSVPG